MARIDTRDWPNGVTPYLGGDVQPFESSETDRWEEYLEQCDGPNRHFVYSLECRRRPEYADVSPDDMWGHPDFNAYNKPTSSEIVYGDEVSLLNVFQELHFQAIHPPGQPEQAIPMWLFLVLNAENVYYVGETANLADRYREHMTEGESSQLFRFFEPTGRVNLLCDCIPRNPSYVERVIARRLSSFRNGQRATFDWEGIEAFAYRGVSGTRYDTQTGWENAPPRIKNHPGWREYWSRREKGRAPGFYDPIKVS